jgi:hypothetical protein
MSRDVKRDDENPGRGNREAERVELKRREEEMRDIEMALVAMILNFYVD